MAYHPQTDGQTKQVNQEVKQFLRLFINQQQDDWYEWLAIAEFAYNDRIHASTHSSPFMMDTGQNPRLSIEPLRESCLGTLNDFTSCGLRWSQGIRGGTHPRQPNLPRKTRIPHTLERIWHRGMETIRRCQRCKESCV